MNTQDKQMLKIREAGLENAMLFQKYYIQDLLKEEDKRKYKTIEETLYFLDVEIQREINQRKNIFEIVSRY